VLFRLIRKKKLSKIIFTGKHIFLKSKIPIKLILPNVSALEKKPLGLF